MMVFRLLQNRGLHSYARYDFYCWRRGAGHTIAALAFAHPIARAFVAAFLHSVALCPAAPCFIMR